jgi:hypothetical protein
VLLEIYTSFRNENEARSAAATAESLAAEVGLPVEVDEHDQPSIRVVDAPASSDSAPHETSGGGIDQATA